MSLGAEERPDQSITKFESMLKTDDVYFFDAEDFEEITHHYLNHGKISLAKKAIKIGLQQHPASVELKLLEIEVHVFENNLDLAEKMLDKLHSVDNTNEEIYIQRANIQSKKDNHQAAIDFLTKALEFTDDSYDIHSLLGMEYLFIDDYEMARRQFEKCLLFDEQDYASLYNIIHCYEFLEDFDSAIIFLNDYLDRNPYCEVAWHQLGKQYFEKEMYKEALTAFDFAIISEDTFIGAYLEKAKVLEKLGKYVEAIENYETTLEIEDPSAFAFLRIGKCHEKLGNIDMAKFYYYQTVHEDPSLDKGWLAITDFYLRQKNYSKALDYITKAINVDEENPMFWKKSAKVHAAMHNFEEADNAYKNSVDLGEIELDVWSEWSKVVIKNDDPDSAIQILIQALEFSPKNAELSFRLAGAYLLLNETLNSKKFFVEALKTDSTKLDLFRAEFPQYNNNVWLNNLIQEFRNASK